VDQRVWEGARKKGREGKGREGKGKRGEGKKGRRKGSKVKGSSLRIRLFLTLDTAGVEVMAIHRAELPSSAARRFVNSFAVDSVCEVSSLLRCSLDSWSQVHHVFVFFTLANSHS
jgi:hypothetical protein